MEKKVTIVRFLLKQYVPPLYCCLQWLRFQLSRDGSWTTATHTTPSTSRASSETKRAQKAAARTGGGLLAFQACARALRAAWLWTLAFRSCDAKHRYLLIVCLNRVLLDRDCTSTRTTLRSARPRSIISFSR
jgi:soluble lytic murein transglycosylase-like protein